MLTNLGKELRLLRLSLDINLKQMAERLGIAPSYLSGIEHGKKIPSRSLINEISKIYDIDLNKAFSLMLQRIEIPLEGLTEQQIALALNLSEALSSLTDTQIQNILKEI